MATSPSLLGEGGVFRRQASIHADILSNLSSVGRPVRAGNLCQITTETDGESEWDNGRYGFYTSVVGPENCKDYTVIGDAANLSAKLKGQAGPGEVVVSEEAYEEVYNEVQAQFLKSEKRMMELKGISHPVATYLLQ